jgi:hypothetical protein
MDRRVAVSCKLKFLMGRRRSESESDKGDNKYDIADPKPGDLSMARLKL